MASPNLTPVDFDPFQAEGEDSAAALMRYEHHLLEMQEQQQQATHQQSIPETPPGEGYWQGVLRRGGEIGSERLARLGTTLRAPGEALWGMRGFTPEEQQQAGSSLAGLAMTGGFGRAMLAGEVPANDLLGIIAGRSAKTADLEALATRNRIAGPPTYDPRNVGAWRQTGWYYGPEGLPKFEISDEGANLVKSPMGDRQAGDFAYQAMHDAGPGTTRTLGEIWDHPALYAAYPHLAEMPVEFGEKLGALGSYSPVNKKITVGKQVLSGDPFSFEQTLAHEVQHAIQDFEGFGKGATDRYYDPKLHEAAIALHQQVQAKTAGLKSMLQLSPEDQKWVQEANATLDKYSDFMKKFGVTGYKLSAGENESNSVMNRLEQSAAQNKLVPPWKTVKVPIESQDVVPQWTRPGYERPPGGFGPESPVPIDRLVGGGGGKGPADGDVAKSTEKALVTPSAEASPPPEAIQRLVEEAKATKWTVDRSHDVPYGAGASESFGKTYIDRRIPSKMRVGGKSFDPAEFLQIHEQVEHKLMLHGLTYEHAHHWATSEERAAVEAAGLSWKKYEKAMERYLDVTEAERDDSKMPSDLYTKPYSHSDLRRYKGKNHVH